MRRIALITACFLLGLTATACGSDSFKSDSAGGSKSVTVVGQQFTEADVMTRGSSGTPAQATMTVVYYIYQNAFSYNRMGKAAAVAWFLFLFIFLFTLIQTRMQRRWVYYEVN